MLRATGWRLVTRTIPSAEERTRSLAEVGNIVDPVDSDAIKVAGMRQGDPTGGRAQAIGDSEVRVAFGSDHRAVRAKNVTTVDLRSRGYEVVDLGTHNGKSCDYPDVACPTAEAVVLGKADRGILMSGTGIGMTIAANKIKGIRAALCHDELTAKLSRRHQDANILCLPADLIGELLLRQIVEVWMSAPFEGGRHARRVDKIAQREREMRSPFPM